MSGLSVTVLAVVAWVFGLVLWEPASEPTRPWSDATAAENNTYWARDLRWALIFAAVMGVVVATKGGRRHAWIAMAGGAVWLVVDALIVRFAYDSVPTAVVAAATVVTAAGWFAARPAGRADRRSLVITTYVCAVLIPAAAGMESPSDTERDLMIGGAVSAAVLLLAMVVAALSATPTYSTRRTVAAAIVFLTVGVLIGLVRADDGSLGRIGLLALLSVTSAWVLTQPFPPMRGIPSYAASFGRTCGLAIAAGLVVAFLLGFGAYVGELFTWLAGLPAVNSSDEDGITSSVGLVAGVIFGILALRTERIEAAKASNITAPSAVSG